MKQFIKENKKSLLGLIIIVFLIIGLTYAWLSLTLNGTKSNSLVVGSLSLILDDAVSTGINLEKAVPTIDKNGLNTSPYTFTLENNGTIASDYTIYLDDVALQANEKRMKDSFVKYNLNRDIDNINTTALISTIGTNPNRVLDSGKIAPGEKYSYTLRLWIDGEATNEVMDTIFSGKIRVEALQKNLNQSQQQ